MARSRQRVVHRAALADQADGVREIVVARAPALDRVLPERALRLVAARIGEDDGQIGRASCRERVCQYVSIPVVDVSFKKKKQTTHEQSNATSVVLID